MSVTYAPIHSTYIEIVRSQHCSASSGSNTCYAPLQKYLAVYPGLMFTAPSRDDIPCNTRELLCVSPEEQHTNVRYVDSTGHGLPKVPQHPPPGYLPEWGHAVNSCCPKANNDTYRCVNFVIKFPSIGSAHCRHTAAAPMRCTITTRTLKRRT
jgi:hypothetical protein